MLMEGDLLTRVATFGRVPSTSLTPTWGPEPNDRQSNFYSMKVLIYFTLVASFQGR